MSKLREDRYSQENLTNDGSVDFAVHCREEVDAFVAEENDPILDRLQHTEVRYETTDHCNATCIMCPRDLHEDGRPHGVMGLAEYVRSIDEVIPLGARRVVLTGFGEPLMDSTLIEKVAYAHKRGLHTYMISNASLLDEKRARGLIEAGLDELRVSVYGTRPETYNAVMKKLDFHKTIGNLTSFLELRDELESKFGNPTIGATVVIIASAIVRSI
jgi:MoaA/NifB/PqqE/SkfB family radical SAM enzyme